MNKLCYSGFIAFWSCVVTMVAIHSLANQSDDTETGNKIYTLSDVAEHTSEDDCWMAIEGKVYDLSAYLAKHPAGPGTMSPWCGQEATDGTRTKDVGSDHSSFAWQILEDYLIGTLQ